MALRHLQGFENVLPTTLGQAAISRTEFTRWFGFNFPYWSSNFFVDNTGSIASTSGVSVVSDEFRIDGQSLRIQRPDSGVTWNPEYNGAKTFDMERNFSSLEERGFVGFAMKLSKAPEVAIPIVQFFNDVGLGDNEMASLWLSPTGGLFLSSVDFDLQSTTHPQTPTPIGTASSGPGAFNFDDWAYIEAELDLSGVTPVFRCYVDRRLVFTYTDIGANKAVGATGPTGVRVLNPPNTYFANDEYTAWYDDMYYGDSLASGGVTSVLGPQHIIALYPDSTLFNNFTIVGGEASAHLAVNEQFNKSDTVDYLENPGAGNSVRLTFQDLPASVVSVSGVQLATFINVTAGETELRFQLEDAANNSFGDFNINWTDIQASNLVFFTAPDDANWDVASVNDLRVFYEVQ